MSGVQDSITQHYVTPVSLSSGLNFRTYALCRMFKTPLTNSDKVSYLLHLITNKNFKLNHKKHNFCNFSSTHHFSFSTTVHLWNSL